MIAPPYQRAVRDALSEATFFATYGNAFALRLADKHEAEASLRETAADPRDLPFVQEALAAIDQGGYAEALARVGYLLARKGEPMLLARLALKEELIGEYRALLPDVPRDEWRRIRGEQEIIARYEPERAIATLPQLLADARDRDRLLKLASALLGDERVRQLPPSAEQQAMLARLRRTLAVGTPHPRRPALRAVPPAPKRPRARRTAATP